MQEFVRPQYQPRGKNPRRNSQVSHVQNQARSPPKHGNTAARGQKYPHLSLVATVPNLHLRVLIVVKWGCVTMGDSNLVSLLKKRNMYVFMHSGSLQIQGLPKITHIPKPGGRKPTASKPNKKHGVDESSGKDWGGPLQKQNHIQNLASKEISFHIQHDHTRNCRLKGFQKMECG